MAMDAGQADDMAPPHGTAIVRPLRHVQAMRERYLQRFTDPAQVAASRAARAWAWALGEDAVSPVTDRRTAVPPSRADIEAEITEADARRDRDDQQGRADAAATILRWLIGADDHLPVRGSNPGELVGGVGDVVRSREQIAEVMAVATSARTRAAVASHDLDATSAARQAAEQEADYQDGVIATLTWAIGESAEAPVSRTRRGELTSRDLKTERLHAQDAADRAGYPWMADRLPPPSYGEAVKVTITWLLGESILSPLNRAN